MCIYYLRIDYFQKKTCLSRTRDDFYTYTSTGMKHYVSIMSFCTLNACYYIILDTKIQIIIKQQVLFRKINIVGSYITSGGYKTNGIKPF